jgi:hypothetical protein
MMTTEMREPRRSPAPERTSDAPQRLRELSDVAKGMAVADGLAMAVGQAFAAEVESVRYGAWDRLREFRQPAELRVVVRAIESGDCSGLQVVPESDLERSLAMSLSVATDEAYRVRVVDKTYGPAAAPAGAMRLTVQVGRAGNPAAFRRWRPPSRVC